VGWSSVVFPHKVQSDILLITQTLSQTALDGPVPGLAELYQEASGLSSFLGSLTAQPKVPYLTAAEQFALSENLFLYRGDICPFSLRLDDNLCFFET
jgi:hypothetical protein